MPDGSDKKEATKKKRDRESSSGSGRKRRDKKSATTDTKSETRSKRSRRSRGKSDDDSLISKKSKSKTQKKSDEDAAADPVESLSLTERQKRFRRSSIITAKLRAETPVPLDALKSRKSIPRIFLNKDRQYPRLPQTVKPKHYDINIFPSVDIFKFNGNLLIKLSVHAQTKLIVLNSSGLKIESVNWHTNASSKADSEEDKDKAKAPTPTLDIIEDSTSTRSPGKKGGKGASLEFYSTDGDDTLIIPLQTPIESGEHTLNITYSGNITDHMKGFYYSKYKTEKLDIRFNYLTNCEPCDCRRIFPCFDEPSFKSTFRLTLTVPKNKTVLSNMPEASIETFDSGPSANLHRVSFETTKFMSTFMFGFIIGDFESVQSMSKDGIVIRVFTPPKLKKRGEFALKIACSVMDYMHDFIGQPFPLSKVDFVAVTEMNTGQVINWGLAIFRDDLLLVRDRKYIRETPMKAYQDIALLVAHAIAIQWLGNMITMLWWSDIWLTIGVATYFKYLTAHSALESMKLLLQFPSQVLNKALSIDMYRKTHRLKMEEVRDPPEISDLYDIIAMDKGASILRMVHLLVGDPVFKSSITTYFKANPYGSVKTEDLWTAFQQNGMEDIKRMMKTWCESRGFPVVTILSADQEGKNVSIKVRQDQFETDAHGKVSSGNLWSIPLNISTSSHASPKKEMLEKKSSSFTLPGLSSSWFLLNTGQTGYFRVKYPKNILMEGIKMAVSKQKIEPIDRVGIIQDLHALALSGYMSVVDVLEFLPAYAEDKNYHVWQAVDDVIQELDYRISYASSDAYIQFQDYVLHLYKQINTEYGIDGFEKAYPPVYEIRRFFTRHCLCCCKHDSRPNHEEHTSALLFALVIRRQIFCGHKHLIYWAKNWFISAQNDERDLHADLYRELTMGFSLWRGSEEDLHILFRAYRKAKATETKKMLIDGFSVFKTNTLIRKILQFAISNVVSLTHAIDIMAGVGCTKLGRHMVWYFFKEHVVHFQREYFQNDKMLKPLFRQVWSHFMTQKSYDDLKSFFYMHKKHFEDLELIVDETLESIKRNISWANRDLMDVNTWLLKLKVEAPETIHSKIKGAKKGKG